jgi:hypothetical protein
MRLLFSFRQTMSGSYWRLDAPADEGAMTFTIEATSSDVRVFVRDKMFHITGTIDAERLASAQPLVGTLAFKLLDERRVAYHFTFPGDDGRRYELSGQEEWRKISPSGSLTILPASVYDERGEEIARATLRFDLRSDWAKWVRSFRLGLSG